MTDSNAFAAKAKAGLKTVLANYGGLLRRRPKQTLLLTGGIICLPVINAHGVAAFLGIDFALAYPVGAFMLMVQVDAWADWRQRRTSRWISGPSMLAISAINMAFVAAGLAAIDADRLGQQLIERQTQPIVEAVQGEARQLDAASGLATKLAIYSERRAESEGGRGEKYAPTCPNSGGEGPGVITDWRKATATSAREDATAFSVAARSARTAANATETARRNYDASAHLAAMDAIDTQVAAINGAFGSLSVSGMTGRLDALVQATGPAGICPDAPLNEMARDLLDVVTAEREAIRFTHLPEPDEELAVHDLAAQVTRVPSGEADLSPYAGYLLLSPLIDLLLMSALAGLWGKAVRDLHREALRRNGLDEDVSESQLADARAAAAQDPRWLALDNTIKVRRRMWTKESVAVADDDAVGLAEAEDMVASKMWRLVGRDAENRFVFALRPIYRKTLWTNLVREHLTVPTPPNEPVRLTVVEGSA